MDLLSTGTNSLRPHPHLLSMIILAPALAAVQTPIVLNEASELFVLAVLAMKAILILTAVVPNALKTRNVLPPRFATITSASTRAAPSAEWMPSVPSGITSLPVSVLEALLAILSLRAFHPAAN